MSRESIENLTKDLKDILIKTKKELKNKDDFIKKHKTVHDLTKKEYQKLYEENTKLKKQVQQYEVYMKAQQIEKRRKEKNEFERQKKELQRRKNEQENDISMLNELKKLKKMDILNLISNKKKEKNDEEDDDESDDETEKMKPPKKRKKKTSVLDLINE